MICRAMSRLLLALALAACDFRAGNAPIVDADATPAVDATAPPSPPLVFNGCSAPGGVRASGTWADPVQVIAPFTDRADTATAASSDVDRYDCAAAGEAGGEVVYQIDIATAGLLRIEVREANGVDVDVHLLRDPAVTDRVASGCIARGNKLVERRVDPGRYVVVVDTFSNAAGHASPGQYVVAIEAWPEDAWTEVAVEDGVVWRHLRSIAGPLGNQSLDVLLIDPTIRDLVPERHGGCEIVADVAARIGARAGINGGFFDACRSLDLVRRDGTTLTRATAGFAARQRAVAWDRHAAPVFAWVDRNADYTAHANAIGSYPSLVTAGEVLLEPELGSAFFTGRNPRTALGATADGKMIMVTADGRSALGAGLTMAELANLMRELGAVDAVNLDGGGSTTMFIDGCTTTGVVNHPSDGVGDHAGSRAVSDGLYVRMDR